MGSSGSPDQFLIWDCWIFPCRAVRSTCKYYSCTRVSLYRHFGVTSGVILNYRVGGKLRVLALALITNPARGRPLPCAVVPGGFHKSCGYARSSTATQKTGLQKWENG